MNPTLSYSAIARAVAQAHVVAPNLTPVECGKLAISILKQSSRRKRKQVASLLEQSLEGQPSSIAWVGAVYEHALAFASNARSHRGVFYTPPAVVEGLLDLTLDPMIKNAGSAEALLAIRIIDPACGTGNFLFAAANRLAAALQAVSGASFEDSLGRVLSRCIRGRDIDPAAIAIAREIAGWNGKSAFAVVDSLEGFASTKKSEQFDLVIGNPPFLNQLRTPTTRSRSAAAAIGKKFPQLALTYADTAFLFLLGGLGLCKSGGTLCMVQPISLLAARDAGPIRKHLLASASLESVWYATDPLFAAGVRVCAPVLKVAVGAGRTKIYRESEFADAGTITLRSTSPTWAGVMEPDIARIAAKLEQMGTGVLGDIADATADFRDEYYALKGCIGEAGKAKLPRVMTSGAIDLARNGWGSCEVRIHKTSFKRPVAKLAAIKGQEAARKRLEKRLVPKVMLATQTRQIEVVVDAEGISLPVTPVITLTPTSTPTPHGMTSEAELFKIAAAAASPIACLWAVAHFGGTGMSIDAIKLSASQVREIPLPADAGRWAAAAEKLRVAQRTDGTEREEAINAFGQTMTAAYGLSGEDEKKALDWWRGRRRAR